MSNISAQNPDLVDTIAEAFFTWFQTDILPVCSAVFDILVIIVGVILNILLIVTFKKRGLLNEASSYFVLMLCVTDYLSYAFLLIPNVISAIANKWILSQPVCEFHGSMAFLLIFLNFAFVTVLSIERCIKLCRQDSELYEKLFESDKIRNVIITVVWVVAVLLSFIPVTGVADIRYDFYHQGCMLDYNETPAFLIVHFLFTVVMSSIVVSICYSLIFNIRRKMLIKTRLQSNKKEGSEKGRNTITSDISGNSLPTISETDDEVFSIEKKSDAFENKPTNDAVRRRQGKRRPKSTRRQSLLFEVFSDDEENPAFHLAITYIALWGTIMACYLPYVCIAFYGTFNNGSVWGGFYSITQLIMHTCYAVKPVVYLGHNRHYRHVAKETIPEGVRNRARSMRTSVTSMTDTLENLLFRSNAHTKFRTALSTQKAVLIWKKRWQKKKGILELKEDRNTSPVLAASIIKQPLENQTEVKTGGTQVTESSNTTTTTQDRKSVTPSGILIQTTTASSYIEEQRQKLLGNKPKSVHWGQQNQNWNEEERQFAMLIETNIEEHMAQRSTITVDDQPAVHQPEYTTANKESSKEPSRTKSLKRKRVTDDVSQLIIDLEMEQVKQLKEINQNLLKLNNSITTLVKVTTEETTESNSFMSLF